MSGLEYRRPRSPVLGERQGGGRVAVGVREMLWEVVEVRYRGAAPFVDGLISIPDGGDREPVAEDGAK